MNVVDGSDMMDRMDRVASVGKQPGAIKQNLHSFYGDKEDTLYPKGDPQPFKAPA